MKIDFKRGKIFNSICPIIFILLSTAYIYYFANVDTIISPFSKFLTKSIICLIITIVFSIFILLFLKISQSKISITIIMVVCALGLPIFLFSIIAAVYNWAPDNLYKTVFIILRALVFILDLIIVFYALFRMHEADSNVKKSI